MDEIRCIRRHVSETVVSPLSLSYSSVQRISALKAKERLAELIKKQSRSIDKQGMYCVLNDQCKSLIPGISLADIKVITNQWEDVLRCSDLFGKLLVLYVLDNCPKVNALHPGLHARLTDARDSVEKQIGLRVIQSISCVIHNLNRAPAVESMVRDTFKKLQQHGYTKNTILECSEAFLSFMNQYFSKRWLKQHSDAWLRVLKALLTLTLTDGNRLDVAAVKPVNPFPSKKKAKVVISSHLKSSG
ncbi:uncharacterized protein LOC106051185 isoform X1 [Biomphalaria glabrata]|uniref:Uncharacterized protein LOC106051185 isoform X1 n=2 Tax=Biomphalaria glabrata TaxID=6526 RepID=A0A9W3A759_BIOGL|nr:uncharacterized protein LOC106051185 isoform X1 [Biomphalaria glabrata]KAI8781713.1 hypothetical protein BgiBS90_017109 [Biomphalaria glabrata]